MMNNIEFDILDELYFIQSYNHLKITLKFSDEVLKQSLRRLIEQGWVTCFSSPTEELAFESDEFEKDYRNYHYLATKAGLLAHNSNY